MLIKCYLLGALYCHPQDGDNLFVLANTMPFNVFIPINTVPVIAI